MPGKEGLLLTRYPLLSYLSCLGVLLVIWLLQLLAPAGEAVPDRHQIRGFAQGTTYQITYYATEKAVTKQHIEQLLSTIDSSLSIYKPYSLISQFNRSTSGLAPDHHLKSVVLKSLEVSERTGGAFDISVLPLVQAWGFGTEPVAQEPDSASIRSLLHCVGADKIRLIDNHLQKAAPCVQIDVNGIAQGYTVDVLADYLETKGINNYLVEIGGEMRIKGRKLPGGDLMAIGIEGPGDDLEALPVQTIISLPEGAVTCSGNYRKFYQRGASKVSHLIDPRTGYPLCNEMISATVVATDATTADGYDNALMGMGVEKALAFAAGQQGVEAYLIYHKADGSVADTATAGFYSLVKK
jgi:thiamine biosynthesis lipoprotein